MSQTAQKPNAQNQNVPDCPLCESPNTTRLSDRIIHKIGGDEFACWECEDTFRIEQLPGGANGGFYPNSMVEREQWMCWFYADKDEREDKIPACWHKPGDKSDYTDRENWTNFNDVLWHLDDKQRYRGITYVLDKDDPFVVFDGDDVRDPETGEVHPDFKELTVRAESYTDISTSGEGAHVIVRGELPEQYQGESITIPVPDSQGFQNAKIEIFDRGRHIVMTGDHVSGTPMTIEDGQEEIDHLCDRWGDAQESEDPESDESDAETVSIPGGYDGGDPPDNRPNCYHAALKAREEHEGGRAWDTNSRAGMLGLAAGYSIDKIVEDFGEHEPPYGFDREGTREYIQEIDENDPNYPNELTLAQGGILQEPECDCPLHTRTGKHQYSKQDKSNTTGEWMDSGENYPVESNPPEKMTTRQGEKARLFSKATKQQVFEAGYELGCARNAELADRVDRGERHVRNVIDVLEEVGALETIRAGRNVYYNFGSEYVDDDRLDEISVDEDEIRSRSEFESDEDW